MVNGEIAAHSSAVGDISDNHCSKGYMGTGTDVDPIGNRAIWADERSVANGHATRYFGASRHANALTYYTIVGKVDLAIKLGFATDGRKASEGCANDGTFGLNLHMIFH